MKVCNKCGIRKHLIDFSVDRVNPDGLDKTCRVCVLFYLKGKVHEIINPVVLENTMYKNYLGEEFYVESVVENEGKAYVKFNEFIHGWESIENVKLGWILTNKNGSGVGLKITEGQRVGKLVALHGAQGSSARVEFKCDCGKHKEISLKRVYNEGLTNCGCTIDQRPNGYEWFDEFMSKWNPITHRTDVKKLPYFTALRTGSPEMVYSGWTYVDNYTYQFGKNIIWTKNIYVKAALSKFNCYKLGIMYHKEEDGLRRDISLHNWVAGLVPVMGKLCTDHISGIKLDNRPSNLRVANPSENSANNKRDSRTGLKGVFLVNKKNRLKPDYIKYRAYVWKGSEGKYRVIGYYDDPLEAAKVVDIANIEQYGEFAKLNLKRAIYEDLGLLPRKKRSRGVP